MAQIDSVVEYAIKCYNLHNYHIEWVNSGSNKVYRVYKPHETHKRQDRHDNYEAHATHATHDAHEALVTHDVHEAHVTHDVRDVHYVHDIHDVHDVHDIHDVHGTQVASNSHNDEPCFYLRISTKGYDYVYAEIDWLMYLKGSINTPVLMCSKNGKIIETFCDGAANYVICVYYEMLGEVWDKNNRKTWNEAVIHNWGVTMGKMHRLTKGYVPLAGVIKRPQFEDRLVSLETYGNIPSVHQKMKQIEENILSLPKDIDSYGLIHSDLDQLNFLVKDNRIYVLDFDDCQYGHFALDIGIALYHALWWGLPDGGDGDNGGNGDNANGCAGAYKNVYACKIITAFMSGYNSENHLSDYWLDKIKLFMMYRQIDALSWHLNYYKPKSMNEVVYNDLFKVHYSFEKHIHYIENDIFYDNCSIDVSDIILKTIRRYKNIDGSPM